jgi:hypothetical protein
LALANGEALAANVVGCLAVADIVGSMISPKRERPRLNQISREARVGFQAPGRACLKWRDEEHFSGQEFAAILKYR